MNGTIRIAEAETPNIKQFELFATDGYLTLPDGQQVYIWGYSLKNEKGSASYPAPTLSVNEGDQVEVKLTNIGAKKTGIKRLAHTIHWHGMDTNQQNDGVPHTSPAIQVGESFIYRFTADHAGTYFYHCHVDTVEHLQMGMHGALIVNAKNGAKQAWTGGPSFDKEYVFQLNEIDPVWHKAVEEGTAYDRTEFHPKYWTINGKAFPDTEKDPSTMIEGSVGQTVLIRMINSGYQPHSFHMHGYHFKVIASDGRPLPQPLTKDTILIGPGERYDLMVTFDQDGMFPFHSHNIVDNTNNGVYPGGLHTMIEIGKQVKPSIPVSVILSAGKKTATVNGVTVTLNTPPKVLNGTLYVSHRFLGEQLGAQVKWNQNQRSLIYTKGNTSIELWLNTKQAKVDGKLTIISTPPTTTGGTIMVPVRFVAEQLGATLTVNKKNGEITVSAEVGTSLPASDGTSGHTGHGSTDGTDSKPPEPADTGTVGEQPVVEIKNNSFSPQKLTVKKGQTVKWVNKDTQIHTVIDLGDSFISKNLLTDGEYIHTFEDSGTYNYYCSTHPSMQAEIIVTD
jgi:plastocyanin